MFVWGGDGTVQRCIDAMPTGGGRSDNVPLAIVPAGTANLLATNLGVPVGDIRAAVHVGLHGTRRAIDAGVLNGERFAVMAGAGFDAQMLGDADGGLKRRFGRLAYVWTGARNTGAPRVGTRVSLDGKKWFDGKAACVLVGNVGTLIGGVRAFPDARPDDGELEVGVVTAAGPWQWGRALGRVVAGHAGDSPFVETAPPRRSTFASTVRCRTSSTAASRREPAAPHRSAARSRHGMCSGARRGAMSTAQHVPETFELTGDDARETLLRTGRGRLLRDAFLRLRYSDGFSHARSLAFVVTLVLVQGTIALVGLAGAFGARGRDTASSRPCSRRFRGRSGGCSPTRSTRPATAGTSQQYLGLAFGLAGALIAGSTAMGQVERGLNRLYGVEQDRPTVEKYTRAAVLAVTAGLLAVVAFAALALGGIHDLAGSTFAAHAWAVLRWPLGVVAIMASVALLFRRAPRRRQPAWSWLAYGASVAVLLWLLATALLALFFSISSSFGDTYGPLAGLVALQIWALLSSIALLYGGTLAAQLEAVRAGVATPQDREKVEKSEPAREAPPLVGATYGPMRTDDWFLTAAERGNPATAIDRRQRGIAGDAPARCGRAATTSSADRRSRVLRLPARRGCQMRRRRSRPAHRSRRRRRRAARGSGHRGHERVRRPGPPRCRGVRPVVAIASGGAQPGSARQRRARSRRERGGR